MKAVVRTDVFGDNVKLLEIPKPKPGWHEVLIRIEAIPINPSDIMFLRNEYGVKNRIKEPPVVIGFEGVGQIVEIGEDVSDKLLNSNVAFMADPHNEEFQGTWAQYIVKGVDAKDILLLGNNIEFDKSASTLMNPLTAISMLDLCHKNDYKAVILSAGASHLGRMINKLFVANEIQCINLIRGEEHFPELQDIGVKYILNTVDPAFDQNLATLCEELKPLAFFDAIGGDFSCKVLTIMPEKSTMYVYGGLSGETLGDIGVDSFIFAQKRICGFWLASWFAAQLPDKRQMYFDMILKNIQHGNDALRGDVVKEYVLDSWEVAVEASKNAPAGSKVLILPNRK